jgi:hypothetical protein
MTFFKKWFDGVMAIEDDQKRSETMEAMLASQKQLMAAFSNGVYTGLCSHNCHVSETPARSDPGAY